MKRFVPKKRISLDGRKWWLVYDNLNKCYSTYTFHYKYTTKKACQFMIDWYENAGYYKNVNI